MGNPQSGGAAVAKFYTSGTWIEGRAEDQLAQVAAWPGMQSLAAFPDLHPGRHGPVGAAFLADRIYPQLIGLTSAAVWPCSGWTCRAIA